MVRTALVIAALVNAVLLSAAVAQATECVFVVNSTADVPEATPGDLDCETAPGNGICTLRAAIMSANTLPLNCKVVIPAGTFVMTIPPDPVIDDASTGDFDIQTSMRIEGAGSWYKTTINANALDRVFEVFPAATLSLTDLEAMNGYTTGNGGLISAEGPVAMTRSRIWVATAASAGGCISTTASLTVSDSVVGYCWSGFGGAIWASLDPSESLRIERSAIQRSHAQYGGGIMAAGGTIVLVNSTVAANEAAESGGGVLAAPLSIYSSTIVENRADTNRDGIGSGGGIVTPPDTPATLFNTVVAGNLVGLSPGDCSGKLVSAVYNVIPTPTSACTVLGSYSYTSPKWSIHYQYEYYIPASDSVATNGGDPGGCAGPLGEPLTTDQRGARRPIGRCDIGAVERGLSGDVDGDGDRDVSDVFYLINRLFAGGPLAIGWTDVNGDHEYGDVQDIFYLINFLFAGGPAPVEPP